MLLGNTLKVCFQKCFKRAEIALGLETDTSEILNEMILSVRPFGRIGITGVYAGFVNHLNIGNFLVNHPLGSTIS